MDAAQPMEDFQDVRETVGGQPAFPLLGDPNRRFGPDLGGIPVNIGNAFPGRPFEPEQGRTILEHGVVLEGEALRAIAVHFNGKGPGSQIRTGVSPNALDRFAPALQPDILRKKGPPPIVDQGEPGTILRQGLTKKEALPGVRAVESGDPPDCNRLHRGLRQKLPGESLDLFSFSLQVPSGTGSQLVPSPAVGGDMPQEPAGASERGDAEDQEEKRGEAHYLVDAARGIFYRSYLNAGLPIREM